MPENYFNRFAALDVQGYLEKKGQFTYLSWAHAVAILRMHDPAATWQVRRFAGLPFLRTETGYFVEVAVTVQGIELSQIHPVLDGKNRVIAEPTAFDINTSIQRCLVKAIALHGLGISVYANEDLANLVEASNDPVPPELPQPEPPAPAKPRAPVTPLPGEGRISQAQMRYLESLIEKTDTDVQRLCDFFHIENLGELTVAAASRAIKSLEAKRRAA
jgi:hypothetical protein